MRRQDECTAGNPMVAGDLPGNLRAAGAASRSLCIFWDASRNDNPLASLTHRTRRFCDCRSDIFMASSALCSSCRLARAARSRNPRPAFRPTPRCCPATRSASAVSPASARFDELLGDGGTRNIASSFSVDSLGGAQIAAARFHAVAIRALTGNNAFSVKAGRSTAAANSRILTAPLMLEYGITSKLTLGVVVPLVETRTTLQAQFNRTLGIVNVGTESGARQTWATNASLVTSLTRGRDVASDKAHGRVRRRRPARDARHFSRNSQRSTSLIA